MLRTGKQVEAGGGLFRGKVEERMAHLPRARLTGEAGGGRGGCVNEWGGAPSPGPFGKNTIAVVNYKGNSSPPPMRCCAVWCPCRFCCRGGGGGAPTGLEPPAGRQRWEVLAGQRGCRRHREVPVDLMMKGGFDDDGCGECWVHLYRIPNSENL